MPDQWTVTARCSAAGVTKHQPAELLAVSVTGASSFAQPAPIYFPCTLPSHSWATCPAPVSMLVLQAGN